MISGAYGLHMKIQYYQNQNRSQKKQEDIS